MDDATRPTEDVSEALDAFRVQLRELIDDLASNVLDLFRARGIPLGEQLADAGHDPGQVLTFFAVALRALADGLEAPLHEVPSGS